MTYLPWYLGGVVLAAVMVVHWLLLRRMMAVSGRYSAIINRLRFGGPTEVAEFDQAAMIAAMREATLAAIGSGLLISPEAGGDEAAPPPAAEPAPGEPPASPDRPLFRHLLFFAAIAVGGLLSALLSGGLHPSLGLRGELFARATNGSPSAAAAFLFLGGILVGFGTRMAGGCTSGHGLCGVSRFQKGSIVSTAGFFATGVVVSLLLGALL